MAAGITYTRGLCITINVLLLIFGGFLLVVRFIFRQAPELNQQTASQGVIVLNVFGPLTVLLSMVGAYAAYKDKKMVLVLFAVFLTTELIALIIIAAPLIMFQSKSANLKKHLINVMMGLISALATIMVAAIVLSLVLGLEKLCPSSPSSSGGGGLVLNDSSGRVEHQLNPQTLS